MNGSAHEYLLTYFLITFDVNQERMRVVGEIPHSDCKITIFSWNNRYLIKLEQGLLEQTFKVHQFDISGESELYRIVDQTFVQEALQRFAEMSLSLRQAMQRA